MRGRPQAIGVCLLGAFLPPINLLCTAVVSLVVLRKGIGEGLFVLVWACLPLLVFMYISGDVIPMIALVGTFSIAYILRTTVSWEITLAAAVVISALGSLIFQLTATELIALLVDRYLDFLLQVQTQASNANEVASRVIVPTQAEAQGIVLGFIAMGLAVMMLLLLVLARWWQSLLYNPGGFGEEFRQIRLSPVLVVVSMTALLACYGLGEFARWANLLIIPMTMAGIAFVHWIVMEKEMSRSWLVSFYLLMVLMSQLVTPMLATLALIDSWMNLRKQIRPDQEV